ncbi:MAG: DUF2079 domain-containing protein [Ruminococcus sp.]|nr:DUF2079 domain-containing protein [Ruminococcus sp.]
MSNKKHKNSKNNKIKEVHAVSSDSAVTPTSTGIESFYLKCKSNILKVCPWITGFIENCGIPDMLFLRFLAVFFFFSGLNTVQMRAKQIYADTQWSVFVQSINIGRTISFMIIGFIMLTIFHWLMPPKYRITDYIFACIAIFYFDIALLWRGMNIYLCLSFAIVSTVLVNYMIGTLKKKQIDILNKVTDKISFSIVMTVAVIVGTLLSITMILRDKCFETQTFDFGIFIQMFDRMAEDFHAITTCERDFELSHFKVHASYIYYILLPFYKIFRSPVTLHIAHSVLVIGGVVPLFLIAKKRNIKGLPLAFIGIAYCFNVGIIGPSYFFFHENSFMPTLLMWLLWAMDNRKYIMLYIMSALVCIVKEDAPFFVIFIGAYMFFEHKGEFRRIHGIIIAVLSGIYMMKILNWLTVNGYGQSMSSSRFGHMMTDTDGGIKDVIKTAFADPSYIFSMLFMEKTSKYLMAIMIPLLFTPFLTKKIHRYLLMMPFIVTNLIIGALYSCAADIGFQYTLGPVTLLIYMSVVNISEMDNSYRKKLPVLITVMSIVFTCGTQTKFLHSIKTYSASKAVIEDVDKMLDSIPKDASVLCDTYYLPHIAQRREIYVLDSKNINQNNNELINPELYDFIVIHVNSNLNETLSPFFEENNYKIYDEVSDRLVVYQTPFYQSQKTK